MPQARFALAVLLLLAVIFFGTPLRNAVRGFFASVIAPRIVSGPYDGLSRAELVAKLSADDAELQNIRYQSTLYGLVVEENTKLKSAGSVQSFAKAIPARVLSRPPQTHYDTLLLDRGTESDISENDIVVFDGIALGKIISVSGTSATAELYSTAGVTHDVLLGTPRAVAVAEGQGGGSFTVSLPRSVTVDVGETVRIPNSETLALGSVVSFSGAATDASQIVYVRSPVSVQSLDYVSIIPSRP